MISAKNSCGLLLIVYLASGCHAIPRFGVGGRYLEAKEEIGRPRGGNLDKAIVNLEGIVRENPTYKDSLTLLGRAYYKRSRYQDASLILQRALAVDREDEIAWLVLGLSQLQLGENQKGLENLKGGLSLLSRTMKENYRGFERWDRQGTVGLALRRAVFAATKGLEEKDALVRNTEGLIARIDEEEWLQGRDKSIERARESQR